ncbi:hypothetical protein ACFE04_016665 [Oxalis oulophora]
MFGTEIAVASNNSHLRKYGSCKHVFYDNYDELANGEDACLHPVEADVLKSAINSVVMPSPIYLWRLKVLWFIIWAFICCKVGWDSVMIMSAEVRDLFLYEAFLYYNPLLLVTMMVWLWGVNLWVFSQANVNYANIFDLDQNHITHREIWKPPILWFCNGVDIPLRYFIFALSLLSLKDCMANYCPSTAACYNCAILVLQAITFIDFFLADILTSMSKVFSDLERSVCRMMHRQVATIAWFEADSVCGSHSTAIPLVLLLPYVFRLFQCLRQYKDTREKTSLLNAFKYSTAIPVIFLSALKYHVLPERWTKFYWPLWLLSSVFNALYSFYWDLTRDWDMSGFTRIFMFSKPNLCSYLFYGRTWVRATLTYLWVIGSNLILRCTWTYKLSAHLRHNYLTVFAITALEIFRRFQWIFFRVENEWNKTSSNSNTHITRNDTKEDERHLLASTHLNV